MVLSLYRNKGIDLENKFRAITIEIEDSNNGFYIFGRLRKENDFVKIKFRYNFDEFSFK